MSIAKQMFSGGNALPIKSSTSTAFGRVNFAMFFDRATVQSRFDRYEIRLLSRTGAWGRGHMRRLFRPGGKKGKKSARGEPPRYHTRGFASLKDGVFFQADLEGGNVVIGPNKLRTKTEASSPVVSGAQLLDEGGTATITVTRYNKPSKSGKVRPARVDRLRARYAPRPYVKQTQEATNAKFVEFTQTTLL